MKNYSSKLCGMLIFFIFLCGCSTDIQMPKSNGKELERNKESQNNYVTFKQVSKIKTGMTYEEVKTIFGNEGVMGRETGEKGTATYAVDYVWVVRNPRFMIRIYFVNEKVKTITQQEMKKD